MPRSAETRRYDKPYGLTQVNLYDSIAGSEERSRIIIMQQIKFDRDVALVVERGREAWRSLRRDETWEKWVAIGRAIDLGRTTIMRHLGTNQPKGRTWSDVFGAWLKQNEFDQIDKGVRSRLQTCIENLPAVEAWRATLGLKRRLELNHPNTVLRRWKAETTPKPAVETQDRQTGMRDLFAAVDRVNDVADKIEHKTGGAELFDMSPELIGESAKNFVEIFGVEETRRFIAALQAVVTPPVEREPLPDPVFAQSLKPGSRRRGTAKAAQASAVTAVILVDEGLASRVRAYVERHPKDTDNIVAQALKCSVEEVRAALAGGGA